MPLGAGRANEQLLTHAGSSLLCRPWEGQMDHATTMRRLYELISAGNIDAFGDLFADNFVEHDELPGLPPTKGGVIALFRTYLTAFPDLRMVPEDVIASGDKVVARVSA